MGEQHSGLREMEQARVCFASTGTMERDHNDNQKENLCVASPLLRRCMAGQVSGIQTDTCQMSSKACRLHGLPNSRCTTTIFQCLSLQVALLTLRYPSRAKPAPPPLGFNLQQQSARSVRWHPGRRSYLVSIHLPNSRSMLAMPRCACRCRSDCSMAPAWRVQV